MPPITKDQQTYHKLSQLYQVLADDRDYDGIMLDDLLQLDDVNFRVFSKKSRKDVLIDGTPLHITGYRGHNKAFDNLLNLGADFTAKNKNGDTALHREFNERFSYGQNQNINIFENKLVDSVLTAHIKFGNAENPHSAYGLSHFHVACAANHLESVKYFIDSGLCVNESVNADSSIFPGYTPLHFAVRFCGYEIAKLLLEHEADIRAKDNKGMTPLHVVVFENLKLERYTSSKSDRGSNSDYSNKCKEAHDKITCLFVDRVSAVDSTGFCKFHAVCTLRDISLAERCLQDVDVNCRVSMDSPLWSGFTALHFAIHSFNIDMVKLLLNNGANVGAEDAKGETPLDLCMKKFNPEELHQVLSIVPSLKNTLFSDNKTTLSDFLDATRSLSTFEEFLRTTPRIMYLPKSCPVWPGYYLSHLLVHFSYVVGLDTVKTYLSLGDNMTIQKDARGRTPLHLAFYQMKTKVLDMFFQHGLVVGEVIDDDGLSHVHVACAMGEENAVQTLLSQGAKVNVVYKGKTLLPRYCRSMLICGSGIQTGSTPLHFAVAMKGNAAIIKVLLHNGADVNAVNAAGITPLHELMYIETHRDYIDVRKEMGNVLLSTRDLVNVVCSEIGLSHLHVACYVGNINAVKVLLKLGADANALTSNYDSESSRYYVSNMSGFSGHMPLDFAMKSGHVKLAKILLKGGADVLRKNSDGMTVLYYFLANDWNRFHINSKFYLSMLAKDATLRKRAEDDCGLTLLHVASYLRDKRVIEQLLTDSRCHVNAQTHADSPIWPKDTPLHLLIRSCHGMKGLKCTVKLLLDCGADVTLTNNVGDTPVHEAWKTLYRRREFPGTMCLLLKYHKDFSFNPANEEGISHFHLACYVSNFAIVEKFLENGVDVNLPIDYRNRQMSFQTSLRFMFESLADTEARLQTIDVLLKYGADVSVQDEKGLTPLHETARREPPRELFFKKLCEAGVKVNSINMHGGTVLEALFRSQESITNEELKFFFDHSNLFNTYNPAHGIGIISLMIHTPEYFRQNREFILKEIMNNHPNLLAVDPVGRTPIHNIVANCDTSISAIEYAAYIEKFIAMGYDIDAQDSDGKTALHFAASFSNEKALLGLLISGADINILDNNKRTAPTILLEALPRKCKYWYTSRNAKAQAKHKIVLHIIAMVGCDLELNYHNDEFAVNEFSEERHRLYCEGVWQEVEMTKSMKIGTGSLTVRDFLSETGAVASRPMMASEADRQAVDKFFESMDHKRYPTLISVLKLQYRKTLKRLPLMKKATHAVREMLGNVNGFSMPELCCRMIIRFLTNSEVERLIMSVSIEKNC